MSGKELITKEDADFLELNKDWDKVEADWERINVAWYKAIADRTKAKAATRARASAR